MPAVDSTAPVLTAKQISRFWAKVAKGEPDDCWPWAATTTRGYGSVGIMIRKGVRKNFPAHLLARWLTTGEWPGRLETCHSCDSRYPMGDITYRLCCNPAHLWIGTHRENMADMMAKGRHHNGPRPRGVTQWKAAFTEAEVLEIRRLFAAGGITLQSLADQHSVSKHCIHCVITRKTWKHLP